ncbi:hypothetical protein B484DRAFT_302063, partial [Ochromonadaceae sp. CCMP2298]
PIILSTNNWIPGTNRYRYNFAQPLDLRKSDASISLFQYSVFNSTFNISESLNNNKFTISWPQLINRGTSKDVTVKGSGNNIVGTIDVTIDNGYYSIEELNVYLQFVCLKYRLYLQASNNASKIMYFLSFSENAIRYASQLNVNYLP